MPMALALFRPDFAGPALKAKVPAPKAPAGLDRPNDWEFSI
jgi:hypothetical protein